MAIEHNYAPDYAAAPGEILDEILDARGISKGDLAKRWGLTPKTIILLPSTTGQVTPET